MSELRRALDANRQSTSTPRRAQQDIATRRSSRLASRSPVSASSPSGNGRTRASRGRARGASPVNSLGDAISFSALGSPPLASTPPPMPTPQNRPLSHAMLLDNDDTPQVSPQLTPTPEVPFVQEPTLPLLSMLPVFTDLPTPSLAAPTTLESLLTARHAERLSNPLLPPHLRAHEILRRPLPIATPRYTPRPSLLNPSATSNPRPPIPISPYTPLASRKDPPLTYIASALHNCRVASLKRSHASARQVMRDMREGRLIGDGITMEDMSSYMRWLVEAGKAAEDDKRAALARVIMAVHVSKGIVPKPTGRAAMVASMKAGRTKGSNKPKGPLGIIVDKTEKPIPASHKDPLEDQAIMLPGNFRLGMPIYQPHGKWKHMKNKCIEMPERMQFLGKGCMGSAHIERGYADGEPIAFVSKTYPIWQNWIGFEPELYLYASSEYLRPLQGKHIPFLIGAYTTDTNDVSLAFDLPHPTGWSEIHPLYASDADKELVIAAYEAIHQRGVLHGDVETRHMLIPDTQLDLSPHAMIIDFGLSRALKPRADIGLARAFREELDLEMRKVKYVLDYKGARDEERKLWYEGGERARFQANKQVRELRKKGDFWPLLWDEVFDETAGEGGEGEVKVWDTRWMWFDPVCGIRKAAEAPARRWDVGFRVKDMPPLDQLLEEVERYDEQDEDEMEVDADEGYIADVSMDVDEENQEQQHPVAGPSGLQPPVRASSERSPTASVSPTSQLSTSTSSNDTLSSTNSTSSTLESILSSATSDMLSSDDARALHYLIHNLGAGNDGSDKAKLERARLICAFIERKREEFLMRTHVLGRAKEALMSCITKFGLDSSSSFDGTMCESKGKGKEKEVVRFDIPVDTVSLKGTSSDTDRVLARVLDTWERSTYPQLDGSVHQDIIVGDRRLRDPAAPRPAHRLTLEGFQSARGLKRKRNDEVVISEEDDDEMPRMIAGGRKRGRRAVSAEPTSSDEVERMIVVRASSGRKNKRARTN